MLKLSFVDMSKRKLVKIGHNTAQMLLENIPIKIPPITPKSVITLFTQPLGPKIENTIGKTRQVLI